MSGNKESQFKSPVIRHHQIDPIYLNNNKEAFSALQNDKNDVLGSKNFD